MRFACGVQIVRVLCLFYLVVGSIGDELSRRDSGSVAGIDPAAAGARWIPRDVHGASRAPNPRLVLPRRNLKSGISASSRQKLASEGLLFAPTNPQLPPGTVTGRRMAGDVQTEEAPASSHSAAYDWSRVPATGGGTSAPRFEHLRWKAGIDAVAVARHYAPLTYDSSMRAPNGWEATKVRSIQDTLHRAPVSSMSQCSPCTDTYGLVSAMHVVCNSRTVTSPVTVNKR